MSEPIIAAESLVKRFGGFTAVNKVSFEVDEGEIVGLIGPNGSGKSTIFNMLSGALKPTEGSVKFKGAEIGGKLPNKICHLGIGRTFQIPRPIHRLSILENAVVAAYFGQDGFGSREQAFDSAKSALEMVGLPTDPGAEISSLGAAGLKKLELARALATGPKLLLADEPTGNLDSATGEKVVNILFKSAQEAGAALVLVTHDASLAARCSRVLEIEDGLIAGDTRQ